MLSGIKFLESKDLLHGSIACSSVLLNDDGEVKISMQERCTVMSKETKRGHPDVQAVEDVLMQLLDKREGANANDLRRWSSTAEEFSSKITSASAEELLQVSEFGPTPDENNPNFQSMPFSMIGRRMISAYWCQLPKSHRADFIRRSGKPHCSCFQ